MGLYEIFRYGRIGPSDLTAPFSVRARVHYTIAEMQELAHLIRYGQ